MKILLVNIPIWKDTGFKSSYNPGMGLLYIGAVLRDRGHEIRIIDAEAFGYWFEDILREVELFDCDCVGISSLSNGLPNALRLCEMLKERKPTLWVSLGGVGPSADIETAKLSKADSICVGEGELIAEKVFTERGIHYGPVVEDLDLLPRPAYDLLQPAIGSNYWSGNLPRPPEKDVRETVVMWSRGCPHACIFCSKASMKRGKPRLRSPDKIVEELKYLKDKFRINSVFVYDDELIGMGTEHEKWLFSILAKIRDEININVFEKTEIWLKGQGRCSEKFITEDTGLMLKDAGFFAMMMGCESGSEKVKKRIKKGTTNDDIRHTLKTLSKWIDIYGFWMIGMPEETETEVRETEKLISEVADYMRWIQITIFSPLPGSDFWKEAIDNNWISKDYNPITNFQASGQLDMPWMNSGAIEKWQKRLYQAYASSRSVCECVA